MLVPKLNRISVVDLYRRSFLLRSLFFLFFVLDLFMAVFSPIIALAVVLLVHVVVFFMYMNSRCLFVSAMLEELHAQKDCASAPEVIE